MQFLNGFVFFGIAVWLPTLFLKMGFSFVHSLLFTGIVTGSGAVGNVVGGVLLDRWGRRPTLIAFSILGGLSLAGWGFSPDAVAVILIGAVGAFFSFGVAGPLFTYVSEIYPTTSNRGRNFRILAAHRWHCRAIHSRSLGGRQCLRRAHFRFCWRTDVSLRSDRVVDGDRNTARVPGANSGGCYDSGLVFSSSSHLPPP